MGALSQVEQLFPGPAGGARGRCLVSEDTACIDLDPRRFKPAEASEYRTACSEGQLRTLDLPPDATLAGVRTT